jgi:hypothetical protein
MGANEPPRWPEMTQSVVGLTLMVRRLWSATATPKLNSSSRTGRPMAAPSKGFHKRTAGTRRASLGLNNHQGELYLRDASARRNHARGTDKIAEPFAKFLAGVCGRSRSAGCCRVDTVLRLAPRSRPSGDLLRVRTNPKELAMASKRPSFQAGMLEVLSLCAPRSVSLPFCAV